MRLLRMMVIVIGIALGGGLLGASIGGLLGYGFPSTFRGHYEVADENMAPDTGETATSRSKELAVGVGDGSDVGMAKKGAALGGALGLIAGLILGLPLALLDQFMLQIVNWLAQRKEGSQLA
jgi:hypothetical protein